MSSLQGTRANYFDVNAAPSLDTPNAVHRPSENGLTTFYDTQYAYQIAPVETRSAAAPEQGEWVSRQIVSFNVVELQERWLRTMDREVLSLSLHGERLWYSTRCDSSDAAPQRVRWRALDAQSGSDFPDEIITDSATPWLSIDARSALITNPVVQRLDLPSGAVGPSIEPIDDNGPQRCAVYEDTVLLWAAKEVRAYRLSTGAELWRVTLEPDDPEERFYFVAMDPWRRTAILPIYARAPARRALRVLDLQSGEERWSVSNVTRFNAVHREGLLIARSAYVHELVDPTRGSTRWIIEHERSLIDGFTTKEHCWLYGDGIEQIDVRTGESISAARYGDQVLSAMALTDSIVLKLDVLVGNQQLPSESVVRAAPYKRRSSSAMTEPEIAALIEYVEFVPEAPSWNTERLEQARLILQSEGSAQQLWEMLVARGMLPIAWLEGADRVFGSQPRAEQTAHPKRRSTMLAIAANPERFLLCEQLGAAAIEAMRPWNLIATEAPSPKSRWDESDAWMYRAPWSQIESALCRIVSDSSWSRSVDLIRADPQSYSLDYPTEIRALRVWAWWWRRAQQERWELPLSCVARRHATRFDQLPDPFAPIFALIEQGVFLSSDGLPEAWLTMNLPDDFAAGLPNDPLALAAGTIPF